MLKLRRNGEWLQNGKKWPQKADELRRLADLLIEEKVQRYLEIGLWRGSTFRYLGSFLPRGSLMVGVDLPTLDDGPADIDRAVTDLRATGHTAIRFLGDSTSPGMVKRVAQYAPYDLVLIDGDHTLRAARSDWENYGAMARIVAFHDIDAERHPKRPRAKLAALFGVHQLWAELKPDYRHHEIIGAHPGAGFGVLWR